MPEALVVAEPAVAHRDVQVAVGPNASVPPLWLNSGLSMRSSSRALLGMTVVSGSLGSRTFHSVTTFWQDNGWYVGSYARQFCRLPYSVLKSAVRAYGSVE